MARKTTATVEVGLIDRLTGPMARLQARVRAFSGRMGIGRLTSAVGDVGRAFNGLGAGLSRSMGRLGGIAAAAGLGAGGAGAALVSLTNQTASTADELIKMSRRLNIPFETLQELAHAANLSGVEFSSLTRGIEGFGRRMGQALDGTKAPLEAFNRLNVPLRTTTGEIRDLEEVLNQTLEALANMEDPVERNNLAFEVFGRSGVEVVQMLNDGTEALAQMRQEAHDLGIVLSEDFANQAEEYNDNIARMQGRLTALRTLIAVELLPVFNDVVLRLSAWLDANRDLIATKIEEWVRTLTGVITDLLDPTSDLRQSIDSVVESFQSFRDTIRPLTDFVGGEFNAVLIALVAYVTGPVVAALATLGLAIGKLSLVILTTPVGWIMMAVAAIAGLAYVIYQNWDGIVDFVVGVIEAIANAFTQFIGWLWGLGERLVEIGASFGRAMATGLRAGWSALIEWLSAAVDSLFAWLGSLGRRMFDVGVGLVMGLWDGLRSKWGELLVWLEDSINGLVGFLPDWVKDNLGLSGVSFGSRPDPASAPERPTGAIRSGPGVDVPDLPDFAAASAPARSGGELEPFTVARQVDSRIDAPVDVKVEVNGLADVDVVRREAEDAVRRAMEDWERNRRSQSQSTLSD